MSDPEIPFNRPYMTGRENFYISQSHFGGRLAGDGPFTKRCHAWLEQQVNVSKALLTHSCTAALEMAALLLNIQSGDEVIVPSYTFVSTANAFVLRGATPVFVDIRSDTLNIDETIIEAAITPRTKAIVPVHYAGVACNMNAIMKIARENDLEVVEDAAQGVMSSYNGVALGGIGGLGALSFHETKNLISGEGGALLINNETYVNRAEVLREKGTDRSRFYKGLVDKYTWQDQGSSYLPGELIASFLWAQLEEAEKITNARLELWRGYHERLEKLERRELLRRPFIPPDCSHNGHMYYVLLSGSADREMVIARLHDQGVFAVFHYVPLHSSPAGKRFGRTFGSLKITDDLSRRLIRLPMWIGLKPHEQDRVVEALSNILDPVT